jgi:hypothetical protein
MLFSDGINNQAIELSFIEHIKTNITNTQTLQKNLEKRMHITVSTTSFTILQSAKREDTAVIDQESTSLEEDLTDSVDDTVADLDILLLQLNSVDRGSSRVDLDGLSTNSFNISTERGREHLARYNVSSEDLSEVGDVLELKLGDSELLGGSGECIIIRSEDSELGIGVHESLIEASLNDERAKDHVVGVLGDSTVDRPIER